MHAPVSFRVLLVWCAGVVSDAGAKAKKKANEPIRVKLCEKKNVCCLVRPVWVCPCEQLASASLTCAAAAAAAAAAAVVPVVVVFLLWLLLSPAFEAPSRNSLVLSVVLCLGLGEPTPFSLGGGGHRGGVFCGCFCPAYGEPCSTEAGGQRGRVLCGCFSPAYGEPCSTEARQQGHSCAVHADIKDFAWM